MIPSTSTNPVTDDGRGCWYRGNQTLDVDVSDIASGVPVFQRAGSIVSQKRRLRRIKESMTYAAENNEIFHLWWHPHNFGVNKTENMRNLQELITHFEFLKEKYGMHSRNMKEISEVVSATEN